jgi:hypothetical protein
MKRARLFMGDGTHESNTGFDRRVSPPQKGGKPMATTCHFVPTNETRPPIHGLAPVNLSPAKAGSEIFFGDDPRAYARGY